jgi:ferrochelatase
VTDSSRSRSDIGILIVNLGSPDATDYWSMRRYYKEFLSDRRVIEVNPVLWWFVLNGPILTFRPSRKAKDYRAIWNEERDEAPLKTITRASAEKLGDRLAAEGVNVRVEWAMRYGSPSIASGLDRLMQQGCERILFFPLYPQYSASTTASTVDAALAALKRLRAQPSLRIVPPYYDDPLHIEALATSMRRALAELPFEPEVILASFHGIPQAYADKGDPYPDHCAATHHLLREALGMSEKQLRLTFQSRFGPAEWLQPYTDKTVATLAQDGVKSLAVVTPGFAADCLETIEEIGVENAGIFKANGGQNFAALPCLNDTAEAVAMLAGIAKRELGGWV